MPKNHVKINLILSIIVLLGILFVNPLRDQAVSVIMLLSFVVLMISLKKKEWQDVIISLITLLSFGVAKLMFDVDQPILALRTAAILAFLFLNYVLLIGPWSRFSKKFLPLYEFRRHFGVAALLLGSVHAALVYAHYFTFSFIAILETGFTFYGLLALLIMFWLGVTSLDYLQKHVKPLQWSILHTILFLVFVWLSYSFYQFNPKTLHLVALGLFGLFWISVAPYSLAKRFITQWVFGWKQLHVLVHVAYWSIVLHVALGVIEVQATWLQILFWGLVAFVLGSHLVGIWMLLKKDHKKYETIMKDDKRFTLVGESKDFKENVGQKFVVNDIPIAIFKYQNKFLAYSNICAHQKGPLSEGKIVNGYLECPWHKFQYSVKDGCGPEGYDDAVPFYKVIEKEGKVYVYINPKLKDKCPRRKNDPR